MPESTQRAQNGSVLLSSDEIERFKSLLSARVQHDTESDRTIHWEFSWERYKDGGLVDPRLIPRDPHQFGWVLGRFSRSGISTHLLIQMFHNWSHTYKWIRNLGEESGGQGRLSHAMNEQGKRLVRCKNGKYPLVKYVFDPEGFIREQEIAESIDGAPKSVSTAPDNLSIMTSCVTADTACTQSSTQTGLVQHSHGADDMLARPIQDSTTSDYPTIESGTGMSSPSTHYNPMSLRAILEDRGGK